MSRFRSASIPIEAWVRRNPGVTVAALEYATDSAPDVMWALLDGTIHEEGARLYPGPWCCACPHVARAATGPADGPRSR